MRSPNNRNYIVNWDLGPSEFAKGMWGKGICSRLDTINVLNKLRIKH